MTLEQWQSQWAATVETVREAEVGGITEEECQEILSLLRSQKVELTPTPLEVLDSTAESWFATAEEAFFECRFDGSGAESLEQMRTIEAEVRTVLDMEG